MSLAYAYAGSLIGRVAELRSAGAHHDLFSMAVWIGSLIATVVVMGFSAHFVTRAFRDADKGGGKSGNEDDSPPETPGLACGDGSPEYKLLHLRSAPSPPAEAHPEQLSK